ncbi:MAG: hypothetical protein RIS36_84 [Pseudomonadota bacterium]|jgi:hypothetical protein
MTAPSPCRKWFKEWISAGVLLVVIAPSDPAFGEPAETLAVSGFVDTYIARDFNHLPTRYRPYTTQPYYTEEGALNLGYVDAVLTTDRFHGRLAVQYGSSVIVNYADEPHEFVRYLQEAYAGVSISDTWKIDAGIFLSHIGMESWISRDEYTPSRSLIADYSPYYQTGVRSIHDLSEDLHLELHVVRGWQNISDDRDPCFGTQIAYQLTEKLRMVYNTFIGDEDGTRVFNDIVIKSSFTENFGISSSFDLGAQNRSDESRAWWHGFAIVPHYRINDTYAIAGRIERYDDPHQIMIQTLSGKSFNATGLSVNLDRTIIPNLVWRNEYRILLSTQDVFPRHKSFSASDSFVMTSLMYSLKGI